MKKFRWMKTVLGFMSTALGLLFLSVSPLERNSGAGVESCQSARSRGNAAQEAVTSD